MGAGSQLRSCCAGQEAPQPRLPSDLRAAPGSQSSGGTRRGHRRATGRAWRGRRVRAGLRPGAAGDHPCRRTRPGSCAAAPHRVELHPAGHWARDTFLPALHPGPAVPLRGPHGRDRWGGQLAQRAARCPGTGGAKPPRGGLVHRLSGSRLDPTATSTGAEASARSGSALSAEDDEGAVSDFAIPTGEEEVVEAIPVGVTGG